MFTQYFGNYLFESNVISLEQFKEALRQLKDKRAKLGVLAIEAGYMTPSQVEDTFTLQKQVDKKFGEIAIQKGYLTSGQLETLLGKQSSPFSVFSQIMIENGSMTYTELSEHLKNYKRKCGMSDENFAKFQNGDVSPVVEKLISGHAGDPKRELIIKAYIEVFIKNVMRFISDDVTIGEADRAEPTPDEWFSCQRISGTWTILSSFSGSEEAMRYVACKYAKAEYTGLDALAQDVLGEFLNCNNGIFTANALEFGADLNLDPQYVTKDKESVKTDDLFRVSFSIENYHYQLNLAF